jgi:tRNA A-37 threonylcarbamoyl transferase component Bud32/WD40 repeat protein
MTNPSSERGQHELQLDALIAEYYEAAERGQPPDRAEFLRLHPDFANELREFFADVGQIEQVAPPLRPALEDTKQYDSSRNSSLSPGGLVRYIGDYEILEQIGSGGMGVVYKARQAKLKKIVALKMIKMGQLASEQEVRRFQAEARAAANLDHPGIVAVHEVGVHHGHHYDAMDYVAGDSLSKLHRDEPVASRRAAELVKQLAEAMHYAHCQGIVHRDLKPANVLLTTTGVPRITDFGLAKRLWTDDDSAAVSMTESGQIIGTAGYMSPEQAAGKTRVVGPPADIYALGAILYALLTSRAPFVGESQSDTILQVIHKEPVSPRTLNPSTPRDLETICLKCLEKEPHKRYGTAQLLADDLQRFLDNRPVLARPLSRPARAWRWCRRNPWAATALALLVILGAGSPPVAYQYYKHAQEIDDQNGKIAGLLETEKELRKKAEKDAFEIGKQKTEIEGLLQTKEAALDDKQRALTDAERKARQIARRNYVMLLDYAPELWNAARLAELRELLEVASAEFPEQVEFAGAYWLARLQETAPLTSLSIPPSQQFTFSSDRRWAACLQAHPADAAKPANVYQRQVLQLYRVTYDPASTWRVQFAHERELPLPFGSHSPKIAFVAGTNQIAVTAGDGPEVHLIDIESGKTTLSFKTRHTMQGRSYFAETGSHFIKYDGDDESWALWSLKDRQAIPLPKLEGFDRQMAELAVSDDGTLVANDLGLVIKVEGGEQVANVSESVGQAQFSPDNRYLIGATSVWRLADGKEVLAFPHTGRCVLSHTQPHIAFGVSGGVLNRIDLQQGSSVPLGTIGPVTNLSLIPGDDTLVIGTNPDALVAWATSRPSIMSTLRIGQIRALSGSRRYAVTVGRTAFEVWDLFDRKKLVDLPIKGEPGRPPQFTLMNCGISDLALVAYTDNMRDVTLFDARQDKVVETWQPQLKTAVGAHKVASITPAGKMVLLGEAGVLHGRDLETRQEWTVLAGGGRTSLDISLDSRWVVAGAWLWDLQKRTKVELPPAMGAGGTSRGQWVTLNGESHLAGSLGQFFNPHKGEMHRIVGPENPYRGITVSPDGRNLAIVGLNLRVYSISTDETPPRLWPVLELQTGSKSWCAFTPDSRTLMLIGQDQVEYIETSAIRQGNLPPNPPT